VALSQVEDKVNKEIITICISVLAFIISAITAWLTLFRKGTVKMTQPTVFFFGPDSIDSRKVFLRTLLYCTAKRGHIVESMWVKLRRGESAQTFNIWVYGDSSLARGSGLYVGENGVACNHHFLLPKDGTSFEFLPGQYLIEVYASLVNSKTPLLLSQLKLFLTKEQAEAIRDENAGVFFDWGPDSMTYHSHIDLNPAKRLKSNEEPVLIIPKAT
jgi:hypothetical protein